MSVRVKVCGITRVDDALTAVQLGAHAIGFVFWRKSARYISPHVAHKIIGSLVYVGKGKCPPQWMGELLESCDRNYAAPTFSATGLYLAGITYDPKWKLPCFIEPPLAAVLPRMFRARKK